MQEFGLIETRDQHCITKKSATTNPQYLLFLLCLQNRVTVRRVVPADDDDEEEDDDDIDETLTERLIGKGTVSRDRFGF